MINKHKAEFSFFTLYFFSSPEGTSGYIECRWLKSQYRKIKSATVSSFQEKGTEFVFSEQCGSLEK